jgi:hypothetical protein
VLGRELGAVPASVRYRSVDMGSNDTGSQGSCGSIYLQFVWQGLCAGGCVKALLAVAFFGGAVF